MRNCPGGSCPVQNHPGAVVWGCKSPGEIVLEEISWGTIVRGAVVQGKLKLSLNR